MVKPLEIALVVEDVLSKLQGELALGKDPESLDMVLAADQAARTTARAIISARGRI